MPKDDTRQRVVANYLATIESATGYETVDGDPKFNRLTRGALVAALREARIFEMRDRDYATLRNAADHHVTTRLCGLPWRPSKLVPGRTPDGRPGVVATYGGDVPAEELTTYVTTLREHIQKLGGFDRLPFPIVWLAWGRGDCIAEFPVPNRQTGGFVMRPRHVIGHLIANEGPDQFVCEVRGPIPEYEDGPFGRRLVNDGRSVEFFWAYHDERWTWNIDTLPWILAGALETIRLAGKATVGHAPLRPSLSDRLKYQSDLKRFHVKRLPPPAYYRITLRPETIDLSKVRVGRPRGPLTYRFDVEGHFLTRFVRGADADLDLVDDLRSRRGVHGNRYRFFRGAAVPKRWRKIFRAHRQALPRPGEFVAVLRSWRERFEKGPKDAPYVPAIRRLHRPISPEEIQP